MPSDMSRASPIPGSRGKNKAGQKRIFAVDVAWEGGSTCVSAPAWWILGGGGDLAPVRIVYEQVMQLQDCHHLPYLSHRLKDPCSNPIARTDQGGFGLKPDLPGQGHYILRSFQI
jgi:hypothetical protein